MMLGLSACGPINSIFARRDLIEGAKAYKDRNYAEAERRFRSAMTLDPTQKQAQLFLARTLHSEYAADRGQVGKAEEAITQYKEILKGQPDDSSSFKAVASLLETMGRKEEVQKWLLDRTTQAGVPDDQKAEAYTSLAAKDNTCANEISDIEPVKKTVEKAGKAEFVFSKPASTEDYEKFKKCIAEGTDYIDKALAIEPKESKEAKSVNIKSLDDKALAKLNDLVKKFESAWSYKTSLLVQNSRLAEMDGRAADKDSYKKESDGARQSFLDLAGVRKAIEDEIEARRKAAEEAKTVGKGGGGGDTNSNSSGNNSAK
jgi:tetratricopeptide (TPR) repeat protein